MIYWGHRITAPLARWLPLWVSYGIATLIAPFAFTFWAEKRNNAINSMAQKLNLSDHRVNHAMRRLCR